MLLCYSHVDSSSEIEIKVKSCGSCCAASAMPAPTRSCHTLNSVTYSAEDRCKAKKTHNPSLSQRGEAGQGHGHVAMAAPSPPAAPVRASPTTWPIPRSFRSSPAPPPTHAVLCVGRRSPPRTRGTPPAAARGPALEALLAALAARCRSPGGRAAQGLVDWRTVTWSWSGVDIGMAVNQWRRRSGRSLHTAGPGLRKLPGPEPRHQT